MLSAVIILMPDVVFAQIVGTPGGGGGIDPVDPPSPAGGGGSGVKTPMGNVLCTVVNWFTGNTGKGLATIAVTIIGIGALLGKVSWGMAMIVGIGVAIVFGAAGLVDAIGAGAGTC